MVASTSKLGNPPWLKLEWNEDLILAEHEPWFELAENPPVPEHDKRKSELLAIAGPRGFFLE